MYRNVQLCLVLFFISAGVKADPGCPNNGTYIGDPVLLSNETGSAEKATWQEACLEAGFQAIRNLNGQVLPACGGSGFVNSYGSVSPGAPNGYNGSACGCTEIFGNFYCEQELYNGTAQCCL